jgi:hypothetical protein
LEQRGIPTVSVFTSAFAPLAKTEARTLGIENFHLVEVPHPLESMEEAEIVKVVDAIIEAAANGLMGDRSVQAEAAGRPARQEQKAERLLRLEGSEQELCEWLMEQGWTDGLPVIAPTPERVEAMLAGTPRDPKTVIGTIPPRWAELTVEKLAVNAVMAGCAPAYMPVLIAALEALSSPPFNLFGIQATTNPAGPMLVVNGPVADQVGIRKGVGALGPGWRANVTIGRAVRLALMNVGGGLPGDTDRATQGMPGKLFFCFAENEELSPWEPLQVEKGLSRDASTVTVFSATGTLNLLEQGSTSGEGLLKTFASALRVTGTNNILLGGEPVLIIGPEHANTLSEDGFDKVKIREWLFDNARVPLKEFSDENVRNVLRKRRPHLFEQGYPETVSLVDRMEDLVIVVAGGPGKHSVFVPTFGASHSVSVLIEETDFNPAKAGKHKQ